MKVEVESLAGRRSSKDSGPIAAEVSTPAAAPRAAPTPSADARVEACVHCGLPLRRETRRSEAYCCTGCWVAAHLAGGTQTEAGGVAHLRARLVLCALLGMGVMVFSLALYGEAWGEAVGADMDGAAKDAVRGMYRLVLLALTTPVVLLLGVPLVRSVVELRRWLSAESLVVFGVGGAYLVSIVNTFLDRGSVYFETTTMVLVLFALGKFIESTARVRAREALKDALGSRLTRANRVEPDGSETTLDSAEIRTGERVRVRPGELVTVDGKVLEGQAFLDVASVTGEEEPLSVSPGDDVCAGSVVEDGSLLIQTAAGGRERMIERVEALLEQSWNRRPKQVSTADRLAGWLLPTALAIALATLVLRWRSVGAEKALFDALSVVLISCPCALGIATPLAYWSALTEAWKRGSLVRGSEVLERLAGARRVLFDKTGTLTSGRLEYRGLELLASDWTTERALALAVAIERASSHPIARTLREVAAPSQATVTSFRTLPGLGVEALVDGKPARLVRVDSTSSDTTSSAAGETRVRLESEGRPVADLRFGGRLIEGTEQTVAALQRAGLELAILSGDGEASVESIARRLDLPHVARLTPLDKLEHTLASGPGTVFVGDGWNDSASIAAADVGISVQGSVERSLERSDVHLMNANLTALPDLFRLARRARWTARANLGWAVAFNACGISLAALGHLNPIWAALLMVASSLIVALQTPHLVRWHDA